MFFIQFSQNPHLKEKLLQTTGTILVEASPWDVLWGIGMNAWDPRALERKNWRGNNWLGFILTELREEFLVTDLQEEFFTEFI